MKQIDCRYCGEGKMVEQTYSRKIRAGRTVHNVEGLLNWRCQVCQSEMTDARQFEGNADIIEAAEKRAAGYVSIAMLREFRERYSLSQKEASKLVGAGDGAFGKYESGGKLSAPTAKLIRAALAIPQVVELLALEEGMEVISPIRNQRVHEFDSSIQEALQVATTWKTDVIPMPVQLSEMFTKNPCTNDSSPKERKNVLWANRRSMEFMLAGAR